MAFHAWTLSTEPTAAVCMYNKRAALKVCRLSTWNSIEKIRILLNLAWPNFPLKWANAPISTIAIKFSLLPFAGHARNDRHKYSTGKKPPTLLQKPSGVNQLPPPSKYLRTLQKATVVVQEKILAYLGHGTSDLSKHICGSISGTHTCHIQNVTWNIYSRLVWVCRILDGGYEILRKCTEDWANQT